VDGWRNKCRGEMSNTFPSGGGGGFGGDSCDGGGMGSTGASPKLAQA